MARRILFEREIGAVNITVTEPGRFGLVVTIETADGNSEDLNVHDARDLLDALREALGEDA